MSILKHDSNNESHPFIFHFEDFSVLLLLLPLDSSNVSLVQADVGKNSFDLNARRQTSAESKSYVRQSETKSKENMKNDL